MKIVLSKTLPITPSDGEVARRIVRNGMADVLAWLGEKVGPKPDDLTHAIAGFDYARSLPGTGVLFVSPEMYASLQKEAVR